MQNQPFQSSFHRSLIFSIANNFAGLDGVPMGAVLEYLAKDPHMHLQFMKYLRAGPKYVCKAIAENLIRAAIEKCDATLVTALLSTGLVTADGIVCLVKGSRCAAVQRSAMLRSIEVTRALLVAGANVKKAYGAWGGPLELAIRSGKKASPVDIELVNLLLEWGAEVRSTHLLFAAREKDDILFRSLMSKFSPLQCHEYLHAKKFEVKSFIDVAIGLLDCELATMAVTLMLQAHFQTGCGKCPQSSRILRRSISNAAMRGFSDLVILLLEYIPKTDLPLAPAVRSGQRDLIELLLEQGAAVDPAAYDLIGDMSPTSTPLAEAIRGGNNELVRDFENRGALSRIRERGRFDAAIYAAAEVNNIAYAQKLLQIAPDISGGALSPALEISIQKGHEDMALLLLRAGADVNVFSNKIGRGLYMDKGDAILLIALRQRNEVLARAVMGCGMEVNVSMHGRPFDSPLLLAVRWGNLGIIRDLLSMGAVVDEDGEIDGVLDRRVNTDDDDDDHRIHCTYQDPRDFRETAVTAAVKGSNKLLVELLVNKYQASLNLFSDRETSPLAAAISNKDTDMLRYLLELGADPACHSAFRKAISGGGELFSELLCAFRAKYPMGKPGFGGVPLSIAIRRNDEQGLDALLEAKFDVNAFAFMGNWMLNSLGTAIREHGRRNLSIIRKLIRAGSDVNEIVARNMPAALLSLRTALLEAISTKNKALVELLVEAGADTNRPAQLGIKRTPLQHACEVGSLEIAEFLLDRGADVNEEPAFRGGATSLQLCTMAGYAGIADKLLKSGADVHAPRPESKGRTALEGAAEHGRLDMLRILWDATAGQGFDAEQIESAMKLAEGNGHLACRDLIQKLRLVGRALIMPEPFDF
ncbi:uncharacterized protein A1O5_06118 [Cladophialophora psammophila CBS 110553]|uniref:Ankyrin n=1 Tax=Cladophialophora psammophila CBS 110553 TaxID=1182543 RepID=W9XL81_9EURO|nr:uncharacterized protein A1O5_06118 [Cladophialophora psammophila CBS 110553]EXJ71124.1 hypothetical protein A1O5_06118 [Cladophialophora psammophila CBS 110553]